jgi:hypothetical protein
MISRIKETESKGYPVLKHYDGTVVLFTTPGKGTVVYSIDGLDPIGKYDEDWAEDRFEYFTHEIILSN